MRPAISWPVVDEMRERWRGRIDLQASCLVGIEAVRNRDWFARLAKRVADARGILGAVTYMVPDLDELLDVVVRLAMEHGLNLDFHADETDDTRAISVLRIAEAVRRNGFQGKVLVGYCCSLARQPDAHLLSQRYDIVAVLPRRWPRHYPNAF